MPSGHKEGTEVVESKFDLCQLWVKRLLEDTQETSGWKTEANKKGKVNQLATKVKNRQGREEKRGVKVDRRGEDDIELTQMRLI